MRRGWNFCLRDERMMMGRWVDARMRKCVDGWTCWGPVRGDIFLALRRWFPGQRRLRCRANGGMAGEGRNPDHRHGLEKGLIGGSKFEVQRSKFKVLEPRT